MTTTTRKSRKAATMRDSMGNDVPVGYVSAYDKARDKAVRRVHARWMKAREALEKCVADCLKDMEALSGVRATEPAPKGNFSARSFDGTLIVQIDQAWRITLDERVLEARAIMEAYVARLVDGLAGTDADAIRAIVHEAFSPGRSGGLPVAKVLRLLALEIDAPDWRRARKLLSGAIRPERGKAYLRVGSRPGPQHDFEYVRLDAADCWPMPGGDAEEV
ncbi:MAG: DUF3164 family protein [Kiritimatiellia bacterium]